MTMLVALVGLVMVGMLPAAADSNSGTVQYVALGDSYAAGQGGGSEVIPCLQSPNGYPYLLDPKMRIDLITNAACTGAKIEGVEAQLVAVKEDIKDASLVTLTVGAADLNLSGVLAACTAGTDNASLAIQAALLLLPPNAEMKASWGGAWRSCTPRWKMRRLTRSSWSPAIRTFLSNLPTGDPDADVINQINTATALLNCAIEKAVADAQDDDVNIVYVDVTEEFAGHGIGSKNPFINSEGLGAYHPNEAGYRAYAKAIFAAIRSAWLDDKNQSA